MYYVYVDLNQLQLYSDGCLRNIQVSATVYAKQWNMNE